MSDHEPPLSDDLRDRLARATSQAPSEQLRGRTLAALEAEGLIRPTRDHRRPLWAAAAAAAALLVFLAGYWAGGPISPPADPTHDGALYLLLLREPPGGLVVDGRDEADLVAEYGAWAREQAAGGRLLRGEKLADRSVRVAGDRVPDEPEGSRVTGFFLIRADDLESATAIARSCPHARYGGEIELRPIEPT